MEFLLQHWALVVVFMAIAVAVLVFVVYRVVWSARTEDQPPRAEGEEADPGESHREARGKVRELFLEGLALLQQNTPHRDYRYRKPWYLYLADAEPGPNFTADETGRDQPLQWRITDQAVLLIADREYFQPPSAPDAARGRR